MISIRNKNCQSPMCREDATYGKDEFHRAQFCEVHKRDTDVCVRDAARCGHADQDGTRCPHTYDFVVETETGQHKVCLSHSPPGYADGIKHLCKYCDIRDDVRSVCVSCRQNSTPKEWAVVRHLKRAIKSVELKHNVSPEGTRKRPDIRYELPSHDVIVEVDEFQHRGYDESCECARLNEIVYAIAGTELKRRPIVFVRYNTDTVRYGGEIHHVSAADRIDLLVKTVNEEIGRVYDAEFSARLVQLWYDAPTTQPIPKQEMDLTRHLVC
jgi:hypothetical protein